MRRLLSILLILVSLGSFAQTFTPSPGNNITVTIGGSTYKAFCPDDYLTCDPSDLYFHVFFHGNSTTTAGTENQVMGKWIKSGGPWNGKVLLNNGDTARVIVLSIPDYAFQPMKYGHAIKTAIQSFTRLNTGLDGTTPLPGHFSFAGLSGGPGRSIVWQKDDTTLVRNLFKRGIFMSTTSIDPSLLTPWTSGGNWFVWWARNDNNGGTPPIESVNLYSNLGGVKDSMSMLTTPSACHCDQIWDSCMTIVGLNSHTGGTAATNRIRRLIDPEDGLGGGPNENPIADAGPDQQITLPTSTASMDGTSSSDPDGTIAGYLWEKISGPSSFSIVSPTSATTNITGLVVGTYVFRLTVTDNQSATDGDDVTVTVLPAPDPKFVVGALRLKTFNNKDFLYYLPDTSQRTTLRQYFVLAAIDSTGKDSTYAVSKGLGKKITNGWNGKQSLSDGDTAVFNIIIQISGIDTKNDIENAIQWALDSIPSQCFDTTTRDRNIMTSGGLGAQRQLIYLQDKFGDLLSQGGTLKFKDNFLTYTFINIHDIDGFVTSNGWSNMKQPSRSWWFYGVDAPYPHLGSYTIKGEDSANNRNGYPNTKISPIVGQTYNTYTVDSTYSSLTNNIANNVFIWWADSVYVPPVYPPAVPISVSPHDVYDLVQAIKHFENLFDGSTATSALTDFFQGFIINEYYTEGIWIDLKKYISRPIVEAYNNNSTTGTIYFQFYYDYTDTSRHSDLFPLTLVNNNWAFADTTVTRTYADSARFMKIVVPTGALNGFSEVRVYGIDQGAAPSILPDPVAAPGDPGRYFQAAGKVFTDTLMDDAVWYHRIQESLDWVDTLTTTWVDGKTLQFNRFQNSTNALLFPFERAGFKSSIYLANVRANFRGPGGSLRKDIPPGSDSTLEASWINTYNTYYGLAAKLGSNASANVTGYTFQNMNAGVGQNKTHMFEINNETMAHWLGSVWFRSPHVQLMEQRAGYLGVKAADPNMKVSSGALIGLRNDRLKAMYFTNLIKYGSKDFPADAISMNEYCTDAGGQGGSNSNGISPERFQLKEKVDSVRKNRDKYFPGREMIISEFGYDGYNYSVSGGSIVTANHESNYNVPDIIGQTREQTKAYWIMREYEILALSQVDRAVQFTQRNIAGGDFATTGYSFTVELTFPGNTLPSYYHPFMTSGQLSSGGFVSLPSDTYWYMVMRARTLKNYKGWPTLVQNGDSTGVWVVKYEHLTNTDSTVYAVWYGTSNNTSGVYQLNIPGVVGAKYSKGTIGDKDGDPSIATILGNDVQIPAYEGVTYVAVKTALSSTTPRFKVRRKAFRLKIL